MAILPTFDELYQIAKAEIQARRPDLIDFNEGSTLDAVAGAAAVLADETNRVAVELFSELFYDTATGQALDDLALDRIGLVRKPATAAVGTVTWTRDSAGGYTIPAGTQLRATVGTDTITVQTTAAVSILSADNTIDIPVQARITGRASNAAAGTITEILDSIGADPGATVTNVEPLAGGSDAETDPQFRDRIRRYYATLRRGTTGALELGALSVPGVSIVTVDESDVEDSGFVYVYIGDPDARSNSVMAGLVETELENWRAAGVLVSVLGAEREEVALEILVSVVFGADLDSVSANIRAALVAYGDTLGPNQAGRRSRVEKAVHDADERVEAVSVITTAGEMTPSAPQNAIRFTETTIDITYGEV